MQRFLTFLVFLMFSNAAMAERILIYLGDEYDSYVDTTTIRKNGNLAKIWEMEDYKTGQNDGDGVYLSEKSQWEYDCQNETERFLSFVTYSGNMGGGKAISSDTYNKSAFPVVPGTLGEIMWKIACGQD